MNRSRKLRDKIRSNRPARAMAAHSPLSAMLAEEAGFDAIWGSGFELSALMGLPDMSFITMTQHLDMLRAINSATQLPVIADIDTGYGNALNVMYAVQEFERAGIAAVVIEDKVFPKTTSLLQGGRQELCRIEEFQGKIEAACNARSNPEFLIVARTEALIAGHSLDDALNRARNYEHAGADLILVHSKADTSEEIERFADQWDGGVELVVVPTSYPDFSIAKAREFATIGLVIYGNHAIRSSISGMKKAFEEIIQTDGAKSVETSISSVTEVFRLQGMDEQKQRERQFLR